MTLENVMAIHATADGMFDSNLIELPPVVLLLSGPVKLLYLLCGIMTRRVFAKYYDVTVKLAFDYVHTKCHQYILSNICV